MNERTNVEIRQSVGARIRRRRLIVGWTLADLAAHVGCRYQQIQKYETGANEIGVVRLFRVAEALDVNVQYFFADIQTLEANAMRTTELYDTALMRVARSIAQLPPRIQDRLCSLADDLVNDDRRPDASAQ